MTPEKRDKIKLLRHRLANLTPEEREELTSRGLIATVEGHVLSMHNTILVYLQSAGRTPSVVGGFQQWKRAGRSVKKGEHGFTIWFPGKKRDEDTEDAEVNRFFTATVFDVSQTEETTAAGTKPEPAAAPSPAPAQRELQPSFAAAPQQQDSDIMKGWSLV
jgi:hypothetical protein